MTADRQVPALIWCPCPDDGTAERIAEALLDEHLVACANLVPNMVSVFRWNGQLDRGSETGALFKTNAYLLARAIARLAELHPYEEPAILGWRCDETTPGTAAWLGALGGGST